MPTATDLRGACDTNDAAAYLGYAPQTLINWRSLRTGPKYVKSAAGVRYRYRDLDAWQDANTVDTHQT